MHRRIAERNAGRSARARGAATSVVVLCLVGTATVGADERPAESPVEDGAVEGSVSDVNAIAASRPRWIEPRRAEPARPRAEVGAEESGATAADAPSWRDANLVLHVRDTARGSSDAILTLLDDLGAERVERRFVEIEIATDQVRYFHPEDAAAATALAGDLESVLGTVEVIGLTFYRPRPESGLLELWVR